MPQPIPAVSVVVPIYKVEKYLRQCVDSILAQTLREIEVILVNDGSPDASPAMCDAYAARDARVRVIHQENLGAGPARNAGLAAARGKYVIFLDPDDRIAAPDVLELLYTKAVEHGVSICGGSLCRIYDEQVDASVLPGLEKQHFSEEGMVSYAGYQYHYGFYRFIYKRSLLVDNKIEFPSLCRYQAPPFMVHAMLAAGYFYAVPQVTYAYRKEHRKVKWKRLHSDALMAGLAEVWRLSINHSMPMLQQEVHRNLCDHFASIEKHLTFAHNSFIREVETATGHQTLTPQLKTKRSLCFYLRKLIFMQKAYGKP